MSSTTSIPVPAVDPEKQERDVLECAWKYIGYPGFCEFSAIEDDFLVLRRFSTLNIRVLLDLQIQITQLEAELRDLDQACRDDPDDENAANRMDSLSWDSNEHNGRQRRGAILRELQPLLHVYLNQVAAFLRIKRQDTATKAQRTNVQNWFESYPNAVTADEQDYINQSSDLITISQTSKSTVQIFCESIPFLQWLFWRRPTTLPSFERGIRIGSDGAMDWFADSIVIALGLVMLFAPMWWLEWVSNDVKRLAIITCFIFIFAVGLRGLSRVKPFEVLAATAAYAAVLMVYMQKQASNAG